MPPAPQALHEVSTQLLADTVLQLLGGAVWADQAPAMLVALQREQAFEALIAALNWGIRLAMGPRTPPESATLPPLPPPGRAALQACAALSGAAGAAGAELAAGALLPPKVAADLQGPNRAWLFEPLPEVLSLQRSSDVVFCLNRWPGAWPPASGCSYSGL